MNILILGSGGREHALAWKIRQSPLCDELYVAPGNGGTGEIAKNLSLNINNYAEIKAAIIAYSIELVVIGPEEPLVNGIADEIRSDVQLQQVAVVGPGKEGAQLEGSKAFSKSFMQRHGIPTAKAQAFDIRSISSGYTFLASLQPPYVLKADGLAAGKGVIITNSLEEAKTTLEELLNGKFGAASETVLIEEYLTGIELSVFVLTDGKNYVLLPEAKDYKRIGEGDTGPNTGGMGAVSPVPFADDDFMQKIKTRIIEPTILGLQKENIGYRGFIFFGLIKVKDDPYVIEYNARMGDPETEVVMPRIKSDIVPILLKTATGELDQSALTFTDGFATTVMMVSAGYPGSYPKGIAMSVEEMPEGVVAFHAGTLRQDNQLVTNGGRVIALTGVANTLKKALENSYAGVNAVSWQGRNYRKDIGQDLLQISK